MKPAGPSVVVELFGLARLRAGRATLSVHAGTLATVLRELAAACPGLAALLGDRGAEGPACLISLNGERFLRDAAEPILADSRLVVLPADAGG